MTRVTSERAAWLIGILGLAGSVVGWMVAPTIFPHAWLAAVTCFLAWPLGSLGLVLIHALTGGAWGFDIRRQLAAGIATLPLALPLLIPCIFVDHALYPWMQLPGAAHLSNRFYLNSPFFYCRWIIYLIAWIGLAVRVLRILREPNPEPRLYRLAPPALIALALTVTFAGIDSTLSMEPEFGSSIFGILICTEALLFALSIALFGMTRDRSAIVDSMRDQGRLLFALLVLWAYLDFMQILIIWNSDLPEEAGWYLHRLKGIWGQVAVGIAVLHFALPFFALITPQVQRSRRAIGIFATILVLIEIPRAWWLVIPAADRNLDWMDVAAMAGVLGVAAGVALHAFKRTRPETRGPAYA
jgi:hypothetical protein